MNNDEVILEQGAAAKRLLESEDYRLVIQGVQTSTYRQFMDTELDEIDKREQLYHILHAFGMIEECLSALADNREIELRRKQHDENQKGDN